MLPSPTGRGFVFPSPSQGEGDPASAGRGEGPIPPSLAARVWHPLTRQPGRHAAPALHGATPRLRHWHCGNRPQRPAQSPHEAPDRDGGQKPFWQEATRSFGNSVQRPGVEHRLGVAFAAQHDHQVRHHRGPAFIIKLDDLGSDFNRVAAQVVDLDLVRDDVVGAR